MNLFLRTLALAFVVAFAVLARPAAAEPTFPVLTGRVVDEAGLLDATQRAGLIARLEALEAKTTDQFVVVTLNSLQGYDIADYGYRLGRHWGIGQAGKNNGVLLIVAPNERKVRIEVGYGLEGTLTDAVASVIIQSAILPEFRRGDMAAGILAGAEAILGTLTDDASIWRQPGAGQPALDQPAFEQAFDFVPYVIGGFIFLSVAMSIAGSLAPRNWRQRRGWRRFVATSGYGMFAGGSSRSSSSGGFSGGGGSFGGGGSSGSW